ncbi:MAG: hypothetical protein AAGB26_13430 [Planctomycetota bacterium]
MKWMNAYGLSLLLTGMAFLFSAAPIDASVIYTLEEVGSDVVLSYTGKINDADGLLFSADNASASGYISPTSGFAAGFELGSVTNYDGSFNGPDAIGSFNGFTDGSTHSGDYFGFDFGRFGDALLIESSYVFGQTMSGSTTFENNTIAGLGVDVGSGSYVWELGNTAGDTITLNIIPEPSSLALGLICFGVLLIHRGRPTGFSCS